MAKVRLDLRNKTDASLQQFAEVHQQKMLGNANFTTPDPDAAQFTNKLGEFSFRLDEMDKAYALYLTAAAEKNQAREGLMGALTKRGNYVENASDGDPAKILSSGFDVRDENRNPIDLAIPQDLRATLGDHAGEIDLSWNPSPGAKAYIVEVKLDAPGEQFQQAKITTRSKATIGGLQSTRTYIFRAKAIGAKGESDWGPEVKRMVV